MNDRLKLLVSGILGTICTFAAGYGALILLTCGFVTLDLISGIIKAKANQNLSSRTGYQGFWRKIALLFTLVFGIAVDLLVSYLAGLGLITMAVSSPIGHIVGVYIIINECISICENLAACGVRLPRMLTDILADVNDKLEGE